jgi:MoaA/NifB/PqqE/SkfB family radical SAM enzyme
MWMAMEKATLDLVQFDLTDECPLFCSHCSNSSGPRLRLSLRYGAVEQAIVDAVDIGCRNFTFSGGEPLRYVDLAKILAVLREYDISPTMFTTGIRDKDARLPLPDGEWAELKALGLGMVVFSVYSGPENRAFHNGIIRLRPVGLRDAFEVNEIGILRARNAGICVEVQFLPSDETSSELSAVAGWAVRLGVSRLHLQYPTRQGRNVTDPSLNVSDSHEPILRANALTLLREGGIPLRVSRLWCDKWSIPTDDPSPSQVIIRSDGAVVRCNACKYIAGPVLQKNIYQESLRQVWKDESWRNALCECSTQRIRQAAPASRRPGVQIMRAHDVLASGAK